MDTNNWRTTAAQSVDPSAETGDDWRTHLPPHLRPKLIIYLMRSLRRIFPFFVQEGQEELNKIAMLFEEKICIAAMSRSDYLEKVLLMRVILDVTPENTFPDSGNNNWLPDTGESHNMQPQVHNQGQRRPMPMSANQSQAHEQILSQNIRSNMGSSGVQSFASLTSALPPVSGLSRTFILDFVARNPTMQNISEALQSSEVNSMGQGVHSNINSRQRQMAGRSQVALQHLKQVRNFLQYLYQQLSNHKYFHQEAIHQQKVIMMQQLMAQEPNATNMMNSLPMLQQQQFNRQAKQQLPAQMQAHQMPQVDQRDDVDEPDVFQQHISRGQHALNTHQQMKSGASFPICSPQSSQSLQAASPHLAEHSSPNIDQQNLLTFFSKDETPLQSGTANSPFIFSSPSSEHSSRTANSPFIFSSPSSEHSSRTANSPFIFSSPSTPLAPSPVPGDSEIVPYELFPNTQQLNQPEMQQKLMKQKMLQQQQEKMVHSPFHASSPSTPLAPSPVPGDFEIVPYELFPNSLQLNPPEMQQKLMKQKMLQQQQEQMVHSPFHASSPSTPLAPSSVPGDSEIALYELFPNSQQLNQPEMQKKLMKQKMLQPQQEEMVHSPFHFSSPSTPLAPSPVPGDSEIALYELLPNSQQLNPPQMQQKLTKQKMLQQQQEEMVHSPFHVSSPSTPLAPSRVPGDSEIALYELFPNSLQLNQPEMPQKLMKQKMLQQEQEQMVHSPFQVSSPSTPLAPAPVPGDSETALYELFPLSNAKPD